MGGELLTELLYFSVYAYIGKATALLMACVCDIPPSLHVTVCTCMRRGVSFNDSDSDDIASGANVGAVNSPDPGQHGGSGVEVLPRWFSGRMKP